MEKQVRKVAVLGAGVMGSAIAAQLANAGIPTLLLDLVPAVLTLEEEKKKLTLAHPQVRNRLATQGKQRALASKPPAFYCAGDADLVSTGNLEDNLKDLSGIDWVIEAVTENLEIKKSLYERLAAILRPGTILSSNTSGLSITALSYFLPSAIRPHFLGTHFFNPPRYLKLLEVIPTAYTDPESLHSVTRVAEERLGKRVVMAKDTPNFIANRIGIHSLGVTLTLMLEKGYLPEEIDALTGPPIGRPKSATLRTADLVGLDTLLQIVKNFTASLPADPQAQSLGSILSLLEKMVGRGLLGEKSGQGFYKRVPGKSGTEIWVLDPHTLEYHPPARISIPSLEQAKLTEDVKARLRHLVEAGDRGGDLAWQVLSASLVYSASRVPEISDDILSVDQAMRWGFSWELGPFEMWDALGVKRVVSRLESEGQAVPTLISDLLQGGQESFYSNRDGERFTFAPASKILTSEPAHPRIVLLSSLKERRSEVLKNSAASLIDLGDGVACLEFHTKMNTIGQDTIDLLYQSLTEVERSFAGLVIGNQGEHFSSGADLTMLLLKAQEKEWEEIETAVRRFQQANMALKYFSKPVVAAPAGLTLGGGCEVCLSCHRVRAAAETYMGLVEIGAGLIPAGGGSKETLLRNLPGIPEDLDVDLFPFMRRALDTISQAKVSSSAREAQELGYLRRCDPVTVNRDFLLKDAKQTILHLIEEGFDPPRPIKSVRVVGKPGIHNVQSGLYNMKEAGFVTPYEVHLVTRLARVLCGGDVPAKSLVSEQHLLDLEREVFLELCGEPKTQERMKHLLETGKPLRN